MKKKNKKKSEKPKYCDTLGEVIKHYEDKLKPMEQNAMQQNGGSYGGQIRSNKGKLTEFIAHSLIMIAWKDLGGDPLDIKIDASKTKIPMGEGYLERIDEPEVRKFIEEHMDDYGYNLSVDKHVTVKDELVLAVECKSYAENSMLKRILVDFDLLKPHHPKMKCYLLQLESQLGGDYSKHESITHGSKSTHCIMSYFSCKLNIITLLEGERKIKEPIHKKFKPLNKKSLTLAKDLFKEDLRPYI